MTITNAIRSKLTAGLSPIRLTIADESHRHIGHAGWRPGGETHFTVEIVSAAFEGKSRVERQRMVLALLAEEMAGRVHALSLRTSTPSEADRALNI